MSRRLTSILLLLAAVVLLVFLVPSLGRTLRLHRSLASLESTDDAVAARARETLVEMGPPAVPYLLEALGRPGGEHRERFAETLRRMDPALLRITITAEIESPDPKRRLNIARAVGWLQDSSLALSLMILLDDPEVEVVCGAVNALAFAGTTIVRPRLRMMLVSGVAQLRGAAAHALGELQDAGAVDLLVRALDDPAAYVRREAFRSLRELGALPEAYRGLSAPPLPGPDRSER